jgi:hypothetical protein
MTIYAIVADDAILSVGNRPKAWRNHTGLQYATDEQLAAIGILPVVNVAQPADTATHTTERSVELVARTRDANDLTMRAEVDQALDGLRQIANSSGTLTAAQLSNAVRLLARVLIRVIRFQLGKLDAVD